MAISANDATAVANAHLHAIITALSQAVGGPWIAANHLFSAGVPPTKAIANFTLPEKADLIALIAMSGPNHCLDGWGFVARSISALVAGDAHSARHFAYYAELRAAKSILASAGIGIFNHDHFAVQQNGDVIRLADVGTHVMVWDALDHWARNNLQAGVLMSEALTVGGVTFADSVHDLWPNTGLRPIAADLVKDWGFDLQQGSKDKEDRNVSSYRPQFLTSLPGTFDESLEFLNHFWTAFEPTGRGEFMNLDRHLLRLAVWRVSRVVRKSARPISSKKYGKLEGGVQALASHDFLNRAEEPHDIRLIEVARQRTAPSPPTEMLARAALLLRTATAVTTKQLHAAGFVAPVDYEFWLGPFSEQRALSSLPSIPTPTFDLWADISDALEEIRELRNSRVAMGQPTKSHDLAQMISSCIPRVGEAERIALWGFCLN